MKAVYMKIYRVVILKRFLAGILIDQRTFSIKVLVQFIPGLIIALPREPFLPFVLEAASAIFWNESRKALRTTIVVLKVKEERRQIYDLFVFAKYENEPVHDFVHWRTVLV